MTQEEKQLLLIDLCARLPYKVMGHATWTYMETNREVKYAEKDRPIEISDLYDVWNFKPYLHPLSSMTEKEKEEYGKLTQALIKEDDKVEYLIRLPNYNTLDWLNEHFYDYRGLIEKRLALKAPEGMYNK